MEEEFVLDVAGGHILLELIADNQSYKTTFSFGENNIFYSKKINRKLSPTQYLIFTYGTKIKDGTYIWDFDLRVDLKEKHLNFDIKINGKCVNCKVPNKQDKKKLKSFFLHTIKCIPEELKINIYYAKWKETLNGKKLVKTYLLKPNAIN